MKNIGFIGLGAIGAPMARRLLSVGFQVSVFDVVPERAEELEEAGARVTGSPQEACEGADAAIVVVMNAAQTEDVLFGESGAVEALTPGSVVAIMCTIGPERVRELADRLDEMQLRAVDAPVTGGNARAEQGDLVVLAGGHKRLLEDVESMLSAMGTIVHCGEAAGDGQAVKMVNQLLVSIHLAAAGEALAYAEALGLDRRFVFETVRQGAANSFMLDNRGKSMLSGDFASSGSKLEILIKDASLVTEAARQSNFHAPIASLVHEIYQQASNLGLAEEEDAGVIRMFEQYRNHLPR